MFDKMTLDSCSYLCRYHGCASHVIDCYNSYIIPIMYIGSIVIITSCVIGYGMMREYISIF